MSTEQHKRLLRRAAGTASVIALLSFGAAPHAGAGVFPGDDGEVAFARFGNIWTIAAGANGPVQRQLTRDNNAGNPRWSPNGRLIAYSTKPGAIKTMRANGTGARTVLAKGGWQPTWDRGTGQLRLAYVAVKAGRGDIYSIPAAGGTPIRLTWDGARNCGNSWPSFSANGQWFAYVQGVRTNGRCEGTHRVVIVNRGTSARTYVSDVPVDDVEGEPTTPVAKDRIEFTADSATLVISGSVLNCFDVFGMVTPSTGAVEPYLNFHCEQESSLQQYIPTPGGNWAGSKMYYADSFMFSPTVRSDDDRGFWQMDVRPIP